MANIRSKTDVCWFDILRPQKNDPSTTNMKTYVEDIFSLLTSWSIDTVRYITVAHTKLFSVNTSDCTEYSQTSGLSAKHRAYTNEEEAAKQNLAFVILKHDSPINAALIEAKMAKKLLTCQAWVVDEDNIIFAESK